MYKTMSVHSAFSQVAPFKRYVAYATSELYDAAGAIIAGGDLASGRVLMDMGKTIVLYDVNGVATGQVLRKVKVLPINSHPAIYTVPTYIHIGDTIPASQKISALN
jgi:hypothetical protein